MTEPIIIDEDGLRFTFDLGIQATQYDDWSHYKNQFKDKCYRDNKAVDIIAHNNKTVWLCEVKDFRQGNRNPSKPPLVDEVAQKVRDSLAGLVSAQFQANKQHERQFAKDVLNCQNMRVVLHIEQASGTRQIYDLADLKDKLKKLLKAIAPHVLILDKEQVSSQIVWKVISI